MPVGSVSNHALFVEGAKGDAMKYGRHIKVKETMKNLAAASTAWVVLLLVGNQLWAQSLTQLQFSQTANDLAVMVQAVEQTTPTAATTAPLTGTFYSAKNPNFPPFPGNLNQMPVWNLGNGLYLLDDTDVDYTTPKRSGGMMAMDASGPPGPGGVMAVARTVIRNLPTIFPLIPMACGWS